MKKIKWNPEDDKNLILLVNKFGNKDWFFISKEFNMISNIPRNRKQIRHRYINFILIKNNKKDLNKKEIIKLFILFRKYGSDWIKLGKILKKDNNILKVNFYKYLRKFYKFICDSLDIKYCILISI